MRISYNSDGTLITLYLNEVQESKDFTEAVCAYMRCLYVPGSKDPRDKIMKRIYMQLVGTDGHDEEDIQLKSDHAQTELLEAIQEVEMAARSSERHECASLEDKKCGNG
jgi:hypothetical protein